MSNFKIVPMPVDKIHELLGKDFVKTFQKEMNAIVKPLRKHIEKGRPLSMGKELWEYVVADSIAGATWNGAGHSVIDVKIGDNTGIDVKSVSKGSKANSTAEASMFQNFDQDAKSHFNNKNTQGIWNIYVNGWSQKVNAFDDYYLLGIMREKETLNCSLCCFHVLKTDVSYDASLCEYSGKKKTGKFLKISGLADPDLISIRYYNSKSRLEIQFLKKCWTDPTISIPIFKF